MRKNSTLFLKIVIVTLGISALAFLLWEPHLEGRNVNATIFQMYFNDPFLAYAYLASIPFFVALYQVFRLLGYIGEDNVFTLNSLRTLRIIRRCVTTLVGFTVTAEAYLFIAQPDDDIAGGVFVGLLIILVFGVIVSVVAMFERILQDAVDIKFESDHPKTASKA